MVVHFETVLIFHDIAVAPGLFSPDMEQAMIWKVYRLILILMAMRNTAIAVQPIIVPGGWQVQVLGLVYRFSMVTFQQVVVATIQLIEAKAIQLIAMMETGTLLDCHTMHLIVVDSSNN